jgi:hypothetical protein
MILVMLIFALLPGVDSAEAATPIADGEAAELGMILNEGWSIERFEEGRWTTTIAKSEGYDYLNFCERLQVKHESTGETLRSDILATLRIERLYALPPTEGGCSALPEDSYFSVLGAAIRPGLLLSNLPKALERVFSDLQESPQLAERLNCGNDLPRGAEDFAIHTVDVDASMQPGRAADGYDIYIDVCESDRLLKLTTPDDRFSAYEYDVMFK